MLSERWPVEDMMSRLLFSSIGVSVGDNPGALIGLTTGELRSNSRASIVGEKRTVFCRWKRLVGRHVGSGWDASDEMLVGGGAGRPFVSMAFLHSSKPCMCSLGSWGVVDGSRACPFSLELEVFSSFVLRSLEGNSDEATFLSSTNGDSWA